MATCMHGPSRGRRSSGGSSWRARTAATTPAGCTTAASGTVRPTSATGWATASPAPTTSGQETRPSPCVTCWPSATPRPSWRPAAWPGNSPGPELLRGGPDGPVAAFPVSSPPGRHSSPTRPGRARARMLPAPNRPAHPRGSDRPVQEPSMSLLIDIFLEPAKAFRQLQEKPSFVLPMAILAVASGLFAMLYFLYVDPEWFASHQEAQVLAGNPEMTQQELAQMRQFMPGARTLAWI